LRVLRLGEARVVGEVLPEKRHPIEVFGRSIQWQGYAVELLEVCYRFAAPVLEVAGEAY